MEIIISEENTVTIAQQQNYNTVISGVDCPQVPMEIFVRGNITFIAGSKLTLPAGSFIGGNGNVIAPPSGGGNSSWIAIGGSGNNAVEWSTSDSTVIGPFQFPESHPLPVELLSFDGYAGFNAVHFNWRVASETNNDFFTIERSKDLVTWSVVDTQPGGGTVSQAASYDAQDLSPERGLMYYRLSQTDFDGTSEIFDPIAIEFGSDGTNSTRAKLYPNPMRSITGQPLFVQNWNDDLDRIVIADMSGRIIRRIDRPDVSSGTVKIEIDPGLFQRGIYFVNLAGAHKSQTLKLLVD